ncbi:DNA-binding response regulator, LuxR family [hydrothermal vent metagenome]|uniref:DNA-binding response regulator, LuxR family n=1 Tax=hydrothermal vent metagenome TaxID=652676 RepID=A0A3B1CTB5_9ZZZZ
MSFKVVVADDHNIFRQGLVRIIESSPDFEIVAEASDGGEAIRLILELRPDIAVLDISMPEKNGLEVSREIMKRGHETSLVILTMYKDEDFLQEAMDLGVKGYVLKSNTAEELLTAMKYASKGESYISPLLSDVLVKRREKIKQVKNDNPSIKTLTPTEKTILHNISQNKTSKQIGEEMFISVRTVQKHRANICSKLNLSGWNALLSFAIKNRSGLD